MRSLLVAVALVAAEGVVVADEPGASLCVATYNLNWGNRRMDQVLDAVRTSEADVVLLQETTLQSERYLRERLRRSHPHFHAAGHKGRYGAERFVFASRWPLRELVFHPPTAGLFGFCTAVCDVGHSAVRLVNVHLSPVVIRRGAGVLEAMAALEQAESRHAAEILAVGRTIDPASPTIVAGDFNSLSAFKAPAHLAKLGFTDSFAAVNEDADAHATWHWPTRPVPLRLRIDYVFHTPHFRTLASRIVPREGSDHALLASELRLVGQGDAPPPGRGDPAAKRPAR